MKALKIHEVQGFKRGEDPYDKLNIGKDRPYRDGDKIKIIKHIYFHDRSGGDSDKKWSTKKIKKYNNRIHDIYSGEIMIYHQNPGTTDGNYFTNSVLSAIPAFWFKKNPATFIRL